MRVGVVGAAGAMGSWLTGYLKRAGHSVSVFDIDKKLLRVVAEREKVVPASRLSDVTSRCEIILVSVPIEKTRHVVDRIVQFGSKAKCIIEISSVKKPILPTLQKHASKSVRILSIHPLFGPGAKSLKGKSIAVIPVTEAKSERLMTRRLFPGADVFLIDAELHDKITALTLFGTFLVNAAWLESFAESPRGVRLKLMGPAAKLQATIAQGYLAGDLELYASLCRNNPYASIVAHTLARRIEEIFGDAGRDGKSLGKRLLAKKSSGLTASAYSTLYELADHLG